MQQSWQRCIAGAAGAVAATWAVLGCASAPPVGPERWPAATEPAHRRIGAEPVEPARMPTATSPGGSTLRNLLVEVRQGDEQQLAGSDVGVRSGSVAAGSGGMRIEAQGGFSAGRRDVQGDVVQRLLVLNGGQGRVAIGSGAPVLEWHQLAWSVNGPVVVGTQRWVDAVRSMSVRPSWPGGEAPVTVELAVETNRSVGAAPATAGVHAASVLTTVQLPLAQWVTVARSADTHTERERGVLSQRQSTASRGYVVQMRVSLP
jgi:hypothetical protein